MKTISYAMKCPKFILMLSIHRVGCEVYGEPMKKPMRLLATLEPLEGEFPKIEDPPMKPEGIF